MTPSTEYGRSQTGMLLSTLDADDARSNRFVTILSYVVVIGGAIYACISFFRWLWADVS